MIAVIFSPRSQAYVLKHGEAGGLSLEQLIDQLAFYDMKIVIGDINTKIEKEEKFIPTIGKESLHKDGNDDDIRLIVAANNLIVKTTQR